MHRSVLKESQIKVEVCTCAVGVKIHKQHSSQALDEWVELILCVASKFLSANNACAAVNGDRA